MEKSLSDVYCLVKIDLNDSLDFSVCMYDVPLFGSLIIDEWWRFEDEFNGDVVWFYDFSYKPSISEIVEVLLPKLKELEYK